MNYAFDLDGTLTHCPRVFAIMMDALMRQGHTVVVLTGAMKGKEITEDEKVSQLIMLGINREVHYSDMFIAIGEDMTDVARKKGRYCRDNKVDMLFEDNEDFIRFVKTLSPTTYCMMVKP